MATITQTEMGWFEARDLPNGDYWTFDAHDDWDEEYAESAIEAWKAWLKHIRTHKKPLED